MKLRSFTVMSLASLCALSAAAGFTADQLDSAAQQIVQTQDAPADCMANGIETEHGIVGCFTPVIAVVDENFFATDAEAELDQDAE